MPATPSPLHERSLQLVREFYVRLEALDIDGVLALFTADAVCEMPFAPPPERRRIEGIDAVTKFMRRMPKLFHRAGVRDLTLSPMLDPEWVVAEWSGDFETAAGRPYRNTYVVLFRAREGRLVHMKECYDPAAIMEAFPPGVPAAPPRRAPDAVPAAQHLPRHPPR